jgi:aminoglycoside 2'-N-acetyltransferase I
VPTVGVFLTSELSQSRLTEVRQLLDQAFAGRFSDDDWEHTIGGIHVLVADGDVIVSHAAVVARVLEVAHRPFNAGYVEGVATAPSRQQEGLGSLAMERVSTVLRSRFAMGGLSTSRHQFYERLGWERWRGPTYVRDGLDEIRTEAEDAGVMVLRFATSGAVDLTAPLSCEARAGDDW